MTPSPGATVWFKFSRWRPRSGFSRSGRRGSRKRRGAVDLENGSDAEEEFLLGRGGTLEGVVRDRSGKPLTECGSVHPPNAASNRLDHVRTGADGRYRLSHLPLGFEMRLDAIRRRHA